MSARAVAVVVHRDRPVDAAATVDRLRRLPEPVEIVVVDNASSPRNRTSLEAQLSPDITILDSGSNIGFGPGANVGLEWWLDFTEAPYGVVLPHDARFDDDTVVRLLDAVDADATIGMASADVGDGATPRVHPWLGPLADPAAVRDGFEDADYSHGTMLALARGCAEQVGLFDEGYFAYCEEADLGLRARRAGWRVGVVRGAEVRNPGMSSTAALIDYLQLRNTYLLVRTHWGRIHGAFRFAVALIELIVGMVRPATRSPFFAPTARLQALADVARGRYGTPPAWLFETRRVAQLSTRPASVSATWRRTRVR